MDWKAWLVVAGTMCCMGFLSGWAWGWTRGYRKGLWRGTTMVGEALNESGNDALGAVTMEAARRIYDTP